MLQYGSQSDWEFMNTAVKEYTEIFYAFIIIIILKALSQTFDLLSDKLDCLECIALEINTFIFRHIMYACFSLSHVNSQNMSRIFSKIFLLMTLDAEILPHICHFFPSTIFLHQFFLQKITILNFSTLQIVSPQTLFAASAKNMKFVRSKLRIGNQDEICCSKQWSLWSLELLWKAVYNRFSAPTNDNSLFQD